MPLDFNTDLMDVYFDANIAADDNYSSPGNFDLPATLTDQEHTQEAMLMIEIVRSYIAQAETVQQLRDMHDIIRKMFAMVKFGGSSSASGSTHFDADFHATNALNAGMTYLAGSPKRLKSHI